jgi:hypothetical protein
MPSERAPLVTVAIPLYRSRRFVECIERNIESIDYPSVEILISDRHHDDDAIDILAERFAGDCRVRILIAEDRLSWVEHYNLLLKTGRGEYFLWMPHDDSYAHGFVPVLVDYLERHPDTVLAFSGLDVVDDHGRILWTESQRDPRAFQNGPWTLGAALRMMMFSAQWWPQFHGLIRRERVVGAGLFIRPTSGNVEPELYWVFALGLLGAVRFVPECSYRKCLHGANISFRWGARRLSHVLDGIILPYGYLRDFGRSRGDLARALPFLVVWGGLRMVGWFTQSWRWPSAQGRARAKRIARRLLFGRRPAKGEGVDDGSRTRVM